jgi:hypothetical protein
MAAAIQVDQGTEFVSRDLAYRTVSTALIFDLPATISITTQDCREDPLISVSTPADSEHWDKRLKSKVSTR